MDGDELTFIMPTTLVGELSYGKLAAPSLSLGWVRGFFSHRAQAVPQFVPSVFELCSLRGAEGVVEFASLSCASFHRSVGLAT